ncbi:AraC family transcriptional regulator [Hymenobacter sp. BT770]|uniref:helix-turn-helix domain-containing protein n=1 Tax=Hymenobacter sp. BT770 TaxID=2886942 RepID=UPI001D12B5D5|nr:AraC family transcriptional regulator [Hymenobacter sp. BT770]MCC3155479.1 AraC family transcriptional regulator [Hymenobacter sp. BT770]MDO3417486.1 AraC family transcriptional regulator [Hymenobacter sp. BT770]
MFYQVFAPCQPLAPFIDSYYVLEGNPWEGYQRVKLTPSGTSGLVVQYGDRLQLENDYHRNELLSESFVFGQLRKYVFLEASGGLKVLGVHFKPTGFYRLFGIPMAPYTDRAVDAELVLGGGAVYLAGRVCDTGEAAARVAVVEEFLLRFLGKGSAAESITDQAVQLILSQRGNLSICGLAQSLQVGCRTLERKFRAEVGILPKQFASIIRFNAMLRARQTTHSSWLDAAYAGGYCDQSHLIRQVKLFCGEVPSQLLTGDTDDLPTLIQHSYHHHLSGF